LTRVHRAFVGIGSNLGDRVGHVRRAFADLGAIPGTRVVARSSLWQTPPWGPVEQPAFVNAVAEVSTALDARVLLAALVAIEGAHGRTRDGPRWGPRTLDLDLLAFDLVRSRSAELELPHPRIAERAFVLVPLAEIDPRLDIPGVGTVQDLLARVETAGCQRVD
jgi:2-amino-4-hydroxy-6-hydroxymethyldihydropteridine diphosphokinase